jgi:hypothetical protein
MKLHKSIVKLVITLALLVPGISNAATLFPAYDIQLMPGDTGYSINATSISIDATVIGIIDSLNNFTDIADMTFTLTGNGVHSVSTPPGAPFPFITGSYDGSFVVGGGVLAGTFTGMILDGPEVAPTLTGDVTFLNGSTGKLEMTLASTSLAGKLGAIVPIPAAAWLFGSGIIGLIGIARRKA